MRKKWNALARARARERFWAPLKEMSGILISYVNNGDAEAHDVIDDVTSWSDSRIVGNRMKSPVCKRALQKILREALLGDDASYWD